MQHPDGRATVVPVHSQVKPSACRDTDDDTVIACAVAAKAEYPVTGDADLLELRSYQGIRIITPRDFEALSMVTKIFSLSSWIQSTRSMIQCLSGQGENSTLSIFDCTEVVFDDPAERLDNLDADF